MSSKVNVLPIVAAHFRTLRHAATGRAAISDYVVQMGIPLLVGGAAWLTDTELKGAYGDIVAALAIIFGFAFAVTVFVFQLRMQMAEMQVSSERTRVAEISPQIDMRAPVLVNELFSNCLYAVLLSGTATLLAGCIEPLKFGKIGDWVLGVMISHLVLVMLMCFKRLNAAYSMVSSLAR
jgi:hypothetical protein